MKSKVRKSLDIFRGKNVLVTGGTGSFGRAFVSYLLTRAKTKAIRVYSRDELKQHEMRNEFKNDSRLRFLIGDVRDRDRLKRACEDIDFIVHAAAMKQVSACEYNPIEAIRTNVDGSINVIEAALEADTPRVIALSSDKAVHPINLYGATKLCAEKLFVQANSYSGPNRRAKFSVVRYGNVLASRGSVVPFFREQMARGEPLTITDRRMTRFWITLDQAVEFVSDSFQMMRGGEIFVPKIPSMKIIDLVSALGYRGKYKLVGIRPGEKIDEYLTTKDEGPRTYELADRYIVKPDFGWWKYEENKIKAKKVDADFCYTSANNTRWISAGEMRELLSVGR